MSALVTGLNFLCFRRAIIAGVTWIFNSVALPR
jgi:hypothetical protein